MVKAIVEIDEKANQILNIVKAKENLKDKSDAINLVIEIYGRELLEPQLRPEFIQRLERIRKEKGIPFKNIGELRRKIEG